MVSHVQDNFEYPAKVWASRAPMKACKLLSNLASNWKSMKCKCAPASVSMRSRIYSQKYEDTSPEGQWTLCTDVRHWLCSLAPVHSWEPTSVASGRGRSSAACCGRPRSRLNHCLGPDICNILPSTAPRTTPPCIPSLWQTLDHSPGCADLPHCRVTGYWSGFGRNGSSMHWSRAIQQNGKNQFLFIAAYWNHVEWGDWTRLSLLAAFCSTNEFHP